MKTKEIVAGLVTLAAALTTWYVIKKRNKKAEKLYEKNHHLTDIFSRAKTYA